MFEEEVQHKGVKRKLSEVFNETKVAGWRVGAAMKKNLDTWSENRLTTQHWLGLHIGFTTGAEEDSLKCLGWLAITRDREMKRFSIDWPCDDFESLGILWVDHFRANICRSHALGWCRTMSNLCPHVGLLMQVGTHICFASRFPWQWCQWPSGLALFRYRYASVKARCHCKTTPGGQQVNQEVRKIGENPRPQIQNQVMLYWTCPLSCMW